MALEDSECRSELTRAGVSFRSLDRRDAPQVEQPIRLVGPIAGVSFVLGSSADATRDHHAIWDCRLALAMVPIAGFLAETGVHEARYVSVLRRGAMARHRPRSMHNLGLAIDITSFKGANGRLAVEDRFPKGRLRDAEGCALSPRAEPDLFVGLVCHVWRARLLHTLLTPDHDWDHRNHLHMDVKPAQPSPANPYVSLASGPAGAPPS